MNEVSASISSFLAAYSKDKKNVAVYGDLMIDKYRQCHVSRLSPEFPIPVINHHAQDPCVIRPGGAGNVCEQFKHFDATVPLFSFINDEAAGYFNYPECLHIPCHIPIKERFYDGDFPLCRLDDEQPSYGNDPKSLEQYRFDLYKYFHNYTYSNRIDVLVASDYSKGVFDPVFARNVIQRCHDEDIISIVDPKKHPFQWQGCTIFKPNLNEASHFLRLEPKQIVSKWKDAVRELKQTIGCQSVVITNGGKGVFGIDNDDVFNYEAEPAKDVRSVIGAGDCFAAVLALAVAYQLPVIEAVKIAYEAAAVYVQKKHNEPIWPHELFCRTDPAAAKNLDGEALRAVVADGKDKHKKVVFTNGCFDILHAGHIYNLEFAKKQGDILIVAVNNDESVKRLKGENRPVNNLSNRRHVLSALSCVDFVTQFGEDTPQKLIDFLKPDVVVKGGQYSPEEVVGYGSCQVVLAPMFEGLSTSKIIEKIKT